MAKDAGGRRNIGSGAFGGSDSVEAVCEIEETSNQTVTRGLRRWWLSKQVQAKTAKILAQRLRPAALVTSWDGKPRVVAMAYDDWRQLCALAVEVRGQAFNDEIKNVLHRIRAEMNLLEAKL